MNSLRFFLFVCCLFLIIACSNATYESALEDSYPIESIHKEYYDKLGGKQRLGPAISPSIREGDISYQYTIASSLVYDHKTDKNCLAPLGKELGVEELAVIKDPSRAEMFLNGHYIYPKFEKVIKEMGGIEVVGNPLTEVRYNHIELRYEQFFENLGFFYREDEQDVVYLLAYGAWKCGTKCSNPAPLNSRIDIPIKKAVPFIIFMHEVGSEFTGFALTEPFIANDGSLEQVFENVVLYINPDYPDRVNLRNLPELVGYQHDQLEPPLTNESYFFFPLDGDLGFNIPIQFLEYIKTRGGFKNSGAPIKHATLNNSNETQQCFEAICIRESEDAYKNPVINPLPLGYLYRDKLFFSQNNLTVMQEQETDNLEISMSIWESYPMVSSELNQEINLIIYNSSEPIKDVRPVLIVMLPGVEEVVYQMPPTNQNGESRIQINPVKVSNGTLVPYQVCIEPININRFCIRDSYLVWDVVKIEQADENDQPAVIRWLQDQLNQFMSSK